MAHEKIHQLVVATTNRGKLTELAEMLGDNAVVVRCLDDFPPVPEPREDGSTFAENARLKARHYANALGQLVLADDSGLQVDALDGKPGLRSARFAGLTSTDRTERDRANNEKLLKLLQTVPTADRSARFRCCLCLSGPDQVIAEVDGVLAGVITTEPRGDNGFGYDPLFYLPHLHKTVAQLTDRQKNAISHRACALQNLLRALEDRLA